ncbi:MAG: hypothetical protein ACKVOX_12665 [Rhizobacter sp.]
MSTSDDPAPQRIDALTGTVSAGPIGAGSKSDRAAVWIKTVQGRYLLRWKTGPSHGDATLDRYVGQRVVCSGFIVGSSLLAERIEVFSPNS